MEMPDRDKDPILITKSKKVRAVLVCYEDTWIEVYFGCL